MALNKIRTFCNRVLKGFAKVFGTMRLFVRRLRMGYNPLRVSKGNRKLKACKETKFLIWNLPAQKTCPFRTEHCSHDCYACKAEKAYPGCLPAREDNFAQTFRTDFVFRMVQTIEENAEVKSWVNATRVVVRIHESGDFYSKAYAMKWLAIAEKVKADGFDNVIFMAYTKSLPFFEGETIPDNFKIRASIWDDTKPELVEMSQKYNIYTAYDRETIDKMKEQGVDFHECRCEDCGTCNECWSDNHKLIVCEIH